jgi:hypothetical protein
VVVPEKSGKRRAGNCLQGGAVRLLAKPDVARGRRRRCELAGRPAIVDQGVGQNARRRVRALARPLAPRPGTERSADLDPRSVRTGVALQPSRHCPRARERREFRNACCRERSRRPAQSSKVVFRTMYSGRCLTSVKMRSTYRPRIPSARMIAPVLNQTDTMRLVHPITGEPCTTTRTT